MRILHEDVIARIGMLDRPGNKRGSASGSKARTKKR